MQLQLSTENILYLTLILDIITNKLFESILFIGVVSISKIFVQYPNKNNVVSC